MSAYCFDTETTDRKEGREIIEAALGRFPAGGDLIPSEELIPNALKFDETSCERYLPIKPITFGAMAVHHILPHELAGCPPSASFKLPEDCAYLIGHSIDFDWEACGSPTNVKRICTHAMAQHVWPDATGHSQSALIYMLSGATEEVRRMLRDAHSAEVDIRLNRLLLAHILLAKPEIKTWWELWSFSEECRIPLTCPMKRYEGVRLEDLDRGFIYWCNQHWLDPYFRKGLMRVLERQRNDAIAAGRAFADDEEDDDFDQQTVF